MTRRRGESRAASRCPWAKRRFRRQEWPGPTARMSFAGSCPLQGARIERAETPARPMPRISSFSASPGIAYNRKSCRSPQQVPIVRHDEIRSQRRRSATSPSLSSCWAGCSQTAAPPTSETRRPKRPLQSKRPSAWSPRCSRWRPRRESAAFERAATRSTPPWPTAVTLRAWSTTQTQGSAAAALFFIRRADGSLVAIDGARRSPSGGDP